MSKVVVFIWFLMKVISVNGEKNYNECKSLFDKGRYQDCISCIDELFRNKSYKSKDEAIQLRASSYEKLGRPLLALQDIEIIERASHSILLQKAKLLIMVGRFEAVLNMLSDSKDHDSKAVYENASNVKKLYTQLEKTSPDSSEKIIEISNMILQACSKDVKVLKIKADALSRKQAYKDAIKTLKEAHEISPGDSDILLKLGSAFLSEGDSERGMQMINSCVSVDEENRACLALRKRVKSLKTEIYNAKDKLIRPSIIELENILNSLETDSFKSEPYYSPLFPNILQAFKPLVESELCPKYCKTKDIAKAKRTCHIDKLPKSKESVEIALEYANALVETGYVEEAQTIANQNIAPFTNDRKIAESYKKLTTEIQKAKQVDYYKILSLPRDATKQQISRAYKKLAQRWHPDKHPKNREEAEKKMRDINTAFSVLSDDKKRREFDMGIDPENPEKPNPFQQHYANYGAGGHAGFNSHGFGGGFEGFEDILRHFNQQQHHRQKGRGSRSGFEYKFDL